MNPVSPRFRNVLITGASSGLGEGLALEYARQGACVYAAARRVDRLEAMAKRVSSGTGTLVPVELDVTKTAEVVERLQSLDDACGGLDLVIANAGTGDASNAKRTTYDALEPMLLVNMLGATATLSALAPRMVTRGKGHLVAISSLAALQAAPGFGVYAATKAYVAMLCQGMRRDLAGTGVKVTCIYPGFVKSELTARNDYPMPFLLETDDAVQRMMKAIDRGVGDFAYPWQLATLAQAARLIPEALFIKMARKMTAGKTKRPRDA